VVEVGQRQHSLAAVEAVLSLLTTRSIRRVVLRSSLGAAVVNPAQASIPASQALAVT
jgi:hypothetical protein